MEYSSYEAQTEVAPVNKKFSNRLKLADGLNYVRVLPALPGGKISLDIGVHWVAGPKGKDIPVGCMGEGCLPCADGIETRRNLHYNVVMRVGEDFPIGVLSLAPTFGVQVNTVLNQLHRDRKIDPVSPTAGVWLVINKFKDSKDFNVITVEPEKSLVTEPSGDVIERIIKTSLSADVIARLPKEMMDLAKTYDR